MGLFKKIKNAVSSATNSVYHAVADPVSEGYHSVVDGVSDAIKVGSGLAQHGFSDPMGYVLGENTQDQLDSMAKKSFELSKKLKSGAVEVTKDKLAVSTKKKPANYINGLAATLATSPLGVPSVLTTTGPGKNDLGK